MATIAQRFSTICKHTRFHPRMWVTAAVSEVAAPSTSKHRGRSRATHAGRRVEESDFIRQREYN